MRRITFLVLALLIGLVLGSYDGDVWVLSGGARPYLPALVR